MLATAIKHFLDGQFLPAQGPKLLSIETSVIGSGKFFASDSKSLAPYQDISRLGAIARKKGFSQVRLSGNEPTLGMPHLLEVLSL